MVLLSIKRKSDFIAIKISLNKAKTSKKIKWKMDYEDMVIAEEPNLSVSVRKLNFIIFPSLWNVFVLIVCVIVIYIHRFCSNKNKFLPFLFYIFIHWSQNSLIFDRGGSLEELIKLIKILFRCKIFWLIDWWQN